MIKDIGYHKEIVAYLHQHQKGWYGEPYVEHVFSVFDRLPENASFETKMTVLYHDVFEDVKVDPVTREPSDKDDAVTITVDDVRKYLSDDIIYFVAQVTNAPWSQMIECGFEPEKIYFLYQGEEKPEYLVKIQRMADKGDIEAVITKYSDNMDNGSLKNWNRMNETQKSKAVRLTEKRYIPSMSILGERIKKEKINFKNVNNFYYDDLFGLCESNLDNFIEALQKMTVSPVDDLTRTLHKLSVSAKKLTIGKVNEWSDIEEQYMEYKKFITNPEFNNNLKEFLSYKEDNIHGIKI